MNQHHHHHQQLLLRILSDCQLSVVPGSSNNNNINDNDAQLEWRNEMEREKKYLPMEV